MAIINVRGTVNRVFFNGKGAELVEKFDIKGKPVQKYWTAWFDAPHGLTEGQEAEVSGMHSDEINEWEKDGEQRRNVKRSINKARVNGAPATPTGPAVDSWQPNSDVPF